jgi:hypothetical protein
MASSKISPEEQKVRMEAVRESNGIHALEGIYPDAWQRELHRKWIAGEISDEEDSRLVKENLHHIAQGGSLSD